jgi:DNA-binding beta-propeller fold protein YncE
MKRRSGIVLLLASATACTLHSEALPPMAMHAATTAASRFGPDQSAQARIYVSDPLDNDVRVYQNSGRNQKPIATITQGIRGPAGLAVDAAGNVYVANTANDTVTMYRRTGLAPVKTYSEGILGPVAVAIDGEGTLYVANFYSFAESIVEFRQGSSRPSLTISAPCGCYPIGLALDGQANLYVAYDNFFEQTVIYQYARGSTSGSILNLRLGAARWETAGMIFDQAANLLVANASLPGIQVFPPGAVKPNRAFGKRGSPRFLQFDPSENDVFVTDIVRGAVEEYGYPSGKLVDVITAGLKDVYGVAVSPRAPL